MAKVAVVITKKALKIGTTFFFLDHNHRSKAAHVDATPPDPSMTSRDNMHYLSIKLRVEALQQPGEGRFYWGW